MPRSSRTARPPPRRILFRRRRRWRAAGAPCRAWRGGQRRRPRGSWRRPATPGPPRPAAGAAPAPRRGGGRAPARPLRRGAEHPRRGPLPRPPCARAAAEPPGAPRASCPSAAYGVAKKRIRDTVSVDERVCTSTTRLPNPGLGPRIEGFTVTQRTHLDPHQRVDLHALVVQLRQDATGRRRPAAGRRRATPVLHLVQQEPRLVADVQEPRHNACSLPREEHAVVTGGVAGELAARLGAADRCVPEGGRRRRGRAPPEAELVQERGAADCRGTLQRPQGVADVVGQEGWCEQVLRLDGHRRRVCLASAEWAGRGKRREVGSGRKTSGREGSYILRGRDRAVR
jgi:hypothetical protein